MTVKEQILLELKDINYAYNECSKYATIKNLLDEMEEDIKIKIGLEIIDKIQAYMANLRIFINLLRKWGRDTKNDN